MDLKVIINHWMQSWISVRKIYFTDFVLQDFCVFLLFCPCDVSQTEWHVKYHYLYYS